MLYFFQCSLIKKTFCMFYLLGVNRLFYKCELIQRRTRQHDTRGRTNEPARRSVRVSRSDFTTRGYISTQVSHIPNSSNVFN